jgi:RNA polymerase sigma factor (sigma-70 family)
MTALALRPAPALRRRQATGFSSVAATLNLPGMDDVATLSAGTRDDTSDETLMLAYAAGQVAAFEQLYARHRTRLYRFLLRQLRETALADDLFQDIWQRVIAARAGWTPDASFASWLYRIAHNRIADHWRSLQYRPPAPENADERTARIPDPDTPERTLSEFEQRRGIQLALDELPDEQREVILLRLEQELTLEEIGAITGVGRETVKSRLRYAMDKLRLRLNE